MCTQGKSCKPVLVHPWNQPEPGLFRLASCFVFTCLAILPYMGVGEGIRIWVAEGATGPRGPIRAMTGAAAAHALGKNDFKFPRNLGRSAER